jgi:hypothetical protein
MSNWKNRRLERGIGVGTPASRILIEMGTGARPHVSSKFIFQPAPCGFMIKREPKSRAFAANLQPERRP